MELQRFSNILMDNTALNTCYELYPKNFQGDDIKEAKIDGARSTREGTGECVLSFGWKSCRENSILKIATYIYLLLGYLFTVYPATPLVEQSAQGDW